MVRNLVRNNDPSNPYKYFAHTDASGLANAFKNLWDEIEYTVPYVLNSVVGSFNNSPISFKEIEIIGNLVRFATNEMPLIGVPGRTTVNVMRISTFLNGNLPNMEYRGGVSINFRMTNN
jgi:hypothetical protein